MISQLKGYWEDRELSEGREDKESHREIELENNLRLLYLFLCGSIQSGKTLFFYRINVYKKSEPHICSKSEDYLEAQILAKSFFK